ncbi:MAG: flavocytochrome c [Spirochaetae bacterium HGW-Spirochaetae-3]|nr:MAG: flavocytochrome c [Spirochaetae bacterium HGW-Spirochaetae-3]
MFSSLLVILAAIAIVSCASSGGSFAAGSYEGVGSGHGGEIRVLVTVSATRIEKIEVLQSDETAMLGDAAFKELSEAIIAANSTEVDAVSGASESSVGFVAAVKDALAKAGVVLSAKKGPAKAAPVVFEKDYDIVVIGGGGAGLSAAISAAQSGARVIVVEKMSMLGGNTVRATGGINAAGTEFQKAAGIADSAESFYKDAMKGGYEKNDPALVRRLAGESAGSVAWLTSLGADLSDVGRLAGASVNRAHRPAGGGKVGPEIVQTLDATIVKTAGVKVYTKTRATAILKDASGAVSGVRVIAADGREYDIEAKAVIIATGGFGANNDMAASYIPSLKGFATTNHPGATGDGIAIAEAAGAALVDMKEIQTHPTYAPGKEMITEAVRGNGAILVSKEGSRFVDELATRDVVSAAVLAQTGKTAFLVFDQSIRASLKAIESYVGLGIVVEGESLEALAARIGSDPARLASSIRAYNGFVAAKKDAGFGRADMPRAIASGPFYAIEITPAIHHTMGGVKIDAEARVISASGSPIVGLWAAGEVTGGVHGGNRLGGNALADIVTFGRIAGSGAAAYAKAAK